MIQAKLAAHGMACFAYEQTKGKGQRGKIWNSEPGVNIILSVILDTSFLQLHQQFYLSAAIALAVHDFFSKYAGAETKIKWPNDIYWRDRKAGGILIETKVASHQETIEGGRLKVDGRQVTSWPWAVAGMGININQTVFAKTIKNPVSLKQITGKDFDSIKLAKELCTFIDKRFLQLQKGDLKKILKQYNQQLFKLNEEVRLKKKNIAFKCRIKGVNESGELLVDRYSQDSFVWGEIEWCYTVHKSD